MIPDRLKEIINVLCDGRLEVTWMQFTTDEISFELLVSLIGHWSSILRLLVDGHAAK